MLRGFFGNLIFAIIARMLCGNHINLTQGNGREVNYKILRPSKVFHGYPFSLIERLSMTFTANGKMKFPFCQNKEKLDLFKLLSCLLPRYIE